MAILRHVTEGKFPFLVNDERFMAPFQTSSGVEIKHS